MGKHPGIPKCTCNEIAMLEIEFNSDFKGYPAVVISFDNDGAGTIQSFLSNYAATNYNNKISFGKNVIIFGSKNNIVYKDNIFTLTIDKNDFSEFYDACRSVYLSDKPCHNYFEKISGIDIVISLNEYIK
jgi:hypothetical protein